MACFLEEADEAEALETVGSDTGVKSLLGYPKTQDSPNYSAFSFGEWIRTNWFTLF